MNQINRKRLKVENQMKNRTEKCALLHSFPCMYNIHFRVIHLKNNSTDCGQSWVPLTSSII